VSTLSTDGNGAVRTDAGEIRCGVLSGLNNGSEVVVVVRPESLVLHRNKPIASENIIEGKIGAAMFLGEYVECTVEVGRNVLQTHQPHTLQVRRGDTVWVELPAGECMALPAEQ
jgi:hypothetical protein